MKVLMVLGPYAGKVMDWDTPVAEVLIGTGEADPYTQPPVQVTDWFAWVSRPRTVPLRRP